ncbi:Nitrilase family, member 2 [Seminavis robusta]|uniref:Nitrilase family, member 2 n=1 Tax=Seminavis robusta TaxID=568900 RepID=A0A9N8HP20_9STRA|nr:Nitrilase family, member 2 [Seminavis robusta]|eukprot:Sro1279_g258830.1 Nitrilase family, member 2 (285) ;mRNA; f:5236-6090
MSAPMPNGLKHHLPEDFVPSDFDFVIGRGKQVKQHSGNQRLYNEIRAVADDYTSGDKARKSFLLSQLVSQVYENSPDAGFVKKDPATGRWYAVEDALARTSAAQAVRDCLHNHYKSSRQFKQQRRRQAKHSNSPVSPDQVIMNMNMLPPSMARSVTPDEAFYAHQGASKPLVTFPLSSSSCKNDLFSILASAFANKTCEQEDPFEPVPIQEPALLTTDTSMRSSHARDNGRSKMQSILHSIDMALEMPVSNLEDLPAQVPGFPAITPSLEPQVDGLFADSLFQI